MSTTTLTRPPTRSAVHDLPTFGEMLQDLLPVIGVVVVAGPPVVFLVGPLLLFALLLVGPFALAATMVVLVGTVLVAAAALAALGAAIAATADLLVGRLGGHHRRHAHTGASAGMLDAVGSTRAAA